MNTKTLISLAPIVLIIVAMYFLMIRPQRKKQKETENMRNNLRAGDNIITIGGIKGKITKIVDDNTLEIEVGAGSTKTKLVMARWSISSADNSAPQGNTAKSEQEEEKSSKPKKLDEAE
ncbi:MAG: preprotein translocase subunit YajC [Clostridiales Family XIII bacterium]|jgi:preprotein translocase subunit YajC|nr:preprotein translocase subunit YajC [Clostridiales Family XIII bacterium]